MDQKTHCSLNVTVTGVTVSGEACTCMAGLSFPVNMYPGQGLNCLVGLLLCDACDDLASLWSALCRSHEPLKQVCGRQASDSF